MRRFTDGPSQPSEESRRPRTPSAEQKVLSSLNRSFEPGESHSPYGRALIQFSTDERIAHLLPAAPPGPIDAHRIVKESGDPIPALCGKSFLPIEIMSVGPSVPEKLATCHACLWKAEGKGGAPPSEGLDLEPA